MGLLVATDTVTLHWVFLLAALMGTANAIETPVRQSFVSELVGKPLLPNALSLSAATFNSARIVGPAVAGGGDLAVRPEDGPGVPDQRVDLPRTAWSRAADDAAGRDATASAGSRRPARTRGSATGCGTCGRREDLIVPLVMIFLVGLLGFNFQLTLPVLAKNVFQVGAGQFGLLTTALASGALVGALASSGRRSRPEHLHRDRIGRRSFGVLETHRRVRPVVLDHLRAAHPDRLLHGLLRPGRATSASSSATDAAHRGSGDGAVGPGLPRADAARLAVDRLAQRAVRPAGRHVGRRHRGSSWPVPSE